jgi:hypothetical protein
MTDRELLEENNKMLKEILSFVRKVDSVEYRDHHDFMEFLRNVAADIWVEYMEPEQRGRLFNLINKKEMKTVFDLSRDEIVSLTCKEIYLYIDKELAGKGIPIEAKNWNIKNEKEVVYPRTGVPVFMLKDIGIGFRTIEGVTEVANLLVKYNAFKMESKFLIGSYEQFWIIGESVCPAIAGEAGYSKEEFDKVNKENKDPELKSINSFNDTVKKANEIKDRVLKYVDKIKRERSYNNDLVGIFERYKDIADGDMEVAMNFIKEAYPFNEETESFIRKKFDMPMPDESKK